MKTFKLVGVCADYDDGTVSAMVQAGDEIVEVQMPVGLFHRIGSLAANCPGDASGADIPDDGA